MEDTVWEALGAAAAAIGKIRGVTECTSEGDNDSGEIIFTLKSGKSYLLRLEEWE